jgi:acylphosphatase
MEMSQQKAISATVTGDDQEVGFRAMVMKQAIEHNLAGVAKNDANMIVRFTLQGDGKRIDKAIAAVDEGTTQDASSPSIEMARSIDAALHSGRYGESVGEAAIPCGRGGLHSSASRSVALPGQLFGHLVGGREERLARG